MCLLTISLSLSPLYFSVHLCSDTAPVFSCLHLRLNAIISALPELHKQKTGVWEREQKTQEKPCEGGVTWNLLPWRRHLWC